MANMNKPVKWLHFGAGNIFRGFIARLADDIGENISAAEGFDEEIIEKIYKPHDNKVVAVTLRANGEKQIRTIKSISDALTLSSDFERLNEIFSSPELQIVSFTITEKGYLVGNGSLMFSIAELLRIRYNTCKTPLALVSMDNCSRNGERLEQALSDIIQENDPGFISWLRDNITFPWTMIDKITPRPDLRVYEELKSQGFEGFEPVTTAKGTYIAPFVNLESAEYLVIEDNFPNGRPALERAGVYFTDRERVGKAEQMKVMTCLNPLHTALAVFGCLLGYTEIWREMQDETLLKLIKQIGYIEGLPVVIDPEIISPITFIDEVVNERFPNPFLPDTPQRIATDTSQKIPIRFGETIKAYVERGEQSKLVGIPLVIAGWLRYLEAPQSSDPRLEELQAKTPQDILHDKTLFGVDLHSVGMAKRILDYYVQMRDRDSIYETLDNALAQ